MNRRLNKGLYAITDGNPALETLLDKTRRIAAAGIAALQYRDKGADRTRRNERAKALQAICGQHGVPFIINDDIELAKTLGADGVHIGQDDPDYRSARRLLGNRAIIGVSCYNDLNAALMAEDMGADYAAFGAFFPTSSKPRTVPAPLELLTEAKQQLTIPIVAIGGITPDNGAELLKAGADVLAVISGIYATDDPARAVRRYNQLFKQTFLQERS